jgi:hypothetical protein
VGPSAVLGPSSVPLCDLGLMDKSAVPLCDLGFMGPSAVPLCDLGLMDPSAVPFCGLGFMKRLDSRVGLTAATIGPAQQHRVYW